MVQSIVIQSFRHKALKRLYHQGDARGINPVLVGRIEDILAHLDNVTRPTDLDLPGFRLHPLKGELKGYWSLSVSGNWRIIFRIVAGDVYDIDLVDYH